MNFFEHQGRARRRTHVLLALFVLALVSIVALVDLVALALFGSYHQVARPDRYMEYIEYGHPGFFADLLERNLGLIFWVSVATAGVIAAASQVRILTLRGGGGTVARGLGGTLVTPDARDPSRRRLRNVVEEMAIASGVPVPEIYVLEREPAINAFAAGYTPADAAVAVTQGALEKLDRAELQGVVAHEFGHILNGDMRLNIRLMGLLFGILMLALMGRFLLGARHLRGGREGRGLVSVGLALLAVGSVGLLFGRLIKASVSRQREFLADASAVQFTRQPQGIAGALKKIAAATAGSVLWTDAEEVTHMLFATGLRRQLLATHPPLIERIRAIEPGFDPRELEAIAAHMQHRPRTQGPMVREEMAVTSEATMAGVATPGEAPALDPETIVRTLGQPESDQVTAAGRLAAAIPRTLARAAHASEWSREVVCYLLMDPDPEIRERQLLMVAEALGQEGERQVRTLLKAVPQLAPELRIPLLEISFPALRRRPERDLTRLLDLVERLIHADGRIDLFEYALARLLTRQIEDVLNPAATEVGGRGRLADSTREVVDLLTILVHQGHTNRRAARAALAAGLARLGARPEAIDEIGEDWLASEWLEEDWSKRLDDALAKLDGIRLEEKQRLLGAMAATVLADGRVAVTELELLRAICATLRMPVPVLEPRRAD